MDNIYDDQIIDKCQACADKIANEMNLFYADLNDHQKKYANYFMHDILTYIIKYAVQQNLDKSEHKNYIDEFRNRLKKELG